ncbi:MAG: glycerophosphodiester phosphodiesterase family protein [Gammaproteobacteria bacterium]
MIDILIAHRGEPETWPENSLTGYREVLQAGARYIETDVQITADGIAVLSHDPSLLKLTDRDRNIADLSCAEILSLPAGYPDRFGNRYQDFHMTTLAEFAELLAAWPDARAFVEIKHASIIAFGIERVIDIMLETLAEVRGQCILISFEYTALEYVRMRSALPVGWVLPHWDDDNRQRARALVPEYLFVNRTRLPPPPASLWDGPWQWVVYTVNRADEIAPFLERGFDMLETNVIRSLLTGEHDHD